MSGTLFAPFHTIVPAWVRAAYIIPFGEEPMTEKTNPVNTNEREGVKGRDANPDPITGAPGSHPVGTGVGAAGGGVAGAAAGAGIGSVVPGIGTAVGGVIGAAVGAIAGGGAGHAIAEQIDPTAEDAYWRENYRTRPYYASDSSYD